MKFNYLPGLDDHVYIEWHEIWLVAQNRISQVWFSSFWLASYMLKEQRQGHSCSHGVKKCEVIQETALDGSCASYVFQVHFAYCYLNIIFLQSMVFLNLVVLIPCVEKCRWVNCAVGRKNHDHLKISIIQVTLNSVFHLILQAMYKLKYCAFCIFSINFLPSGYFQVKGNTLNKK